jgi:hypothetical protein
VVHLPPPFTKALNLEKKRKEKKRKKKKKNKTQHTTCILPIVTFQ